MSEFSRSVLNNPNTVSIITMNGTRYMLSLAIVGVVIAAATTISFWGLTQFAKAQQQASQGYCFTVHRNGQLPGRTGFSADLICQPTLALCESVRAQYLSMFPSQVATECRQQAVPPAPAA